MVSSGMKNVLVVLVALTCLVGCSATKTPSGESTPVAPKPVAAATPPAADEVIPAKDSENEALPPKAVAFRLGRKLSLAVLGRSRGADDEAVSRMMDGANRFAENLGMGPLPALPEKSGEVVDDMASAIEYLLTTTGPSRSKSLNEKHGEQVGALFELAMRYNLAFLLYVADPSDSMVKPLVAGLEKNAMTAKLPPELWKPVLDSMRAGEPKETVQEELQQTQNSIMEHLLKSYFVRE